MDKEVYVRWCDCVPESGERPLRGIIRFKLEGDKFTFEKISGSSIPTEALIGLLWHYPPLKEFREAAASCKRKCQWAVKQYDGISGSSTWYILHLGRKGRVIISDPVLHSSMCGKQNSDIECWIRDIYDVLWELKRKGCYPNAFSDDASTDPWGYVDLTEEILSRREEFLKKCHEPNVGFGSNAIDPRDEEPIVDYSNYTPTTDEEKEIDDNGLRPVVPVSSKEDDEDEYI